MTVIGGKIVPCVVDVHRITLSELDTHFCVTQ